MLYTNRNNQTNQPIPLPMDWTRGDTIGHGSSATVSIATSHRSGQVFAVKSVELSQSKTLQREQSILSQLASPRIVKYMGCDVSRENGNLMYNLFMERISGGTLSDLIRNQGGSFDESTIQSRMREIVQGLNYLHSQGLVHCDIKGRNILIGADGAKIADFGCSKWVKDNWNMSNDVEESIAGTPVFMAPEVARGEEQGFAADIWALGCVIIEMATGCPPWSNAPHPLSVLYRIAVSEEIPEIPSFLSDQAKDFLGKCLRRNPKERWTVDRLLTHPFIQENNSKLSSFQVTDSNSPTSVLEQDFWNSNEETSTIGNSNQIGFISSAVARLQKLTTGGFCLCPMVLDWTWDENWVTIRSNKNGTGGAPPTPRDEPEMASEPSTPHGEPEMASEPSTVFISREGQLELSESCVADLKNMLSCCNVNDGHTRSNFFDTNSFVGFISHVDYVPLKEIRTSRITRNLCDTRSVNLWNFVVRTTCLIQTTMIGFKTFSNGLSCVNI